MAEQQGRAAVHEQLRKVDASAAERLAPNDLVRVSRALEVFELTGRTQTEWHAEHAFRTPRYAARLVGVQRDRGAIDERIATRTEHWLAAGWIDEVRQLVAAGHGDARAMLSVGYRQVHQHVTGDLSRDQLALAIVRATRKFTRRQRTWLRDQPVLWLDPTSMPPGSRE